MSDAPSVAIVTPSYNTGRYLGAAIDSVLAQDYQPIDYLVMDGGSTDATLDVLRSYGNRLRWTSGTDAGQADAINRGFAQTKGDVLGWLNSDDEYAPGAVRAAAEFLRDHPDVALVYGDAEFIDPAGNPIGRCEHVEPFDLNRLLHYSDFIVQPAAFFRRSAFEAVGGLDPSLHWAMDYDLWIRLARRFHVAYLPRMLARYRWLSDSKSAAGGWERINEVARVARNHGLGLPAYFRLEKVYLHAQEARGALRSGHPLDCLRSLGGAVSSVLGSTRAMRSLFSPLTWRVIRMGQVLRARAAAGSRVPPAQSSAPDAP